jgi:hypothetical protein
VSGSARVLFVSPNTEDYLADSIFHGLRTLLGADVVDFPKAEYMYDTFPRTGELYGHGFTLYGLLPEIDVDRTRVLERAEAGEFDLVVFGDIWRVFGLFTQLAPRLDPKRVAVLDGADRLELFPYAGPWARVPGWWFLPRAHRRFAYFKRELTSVARPFGGNVRPISFAIPEEKIVAAPPAKAKDFNAHIVDSEVAEAVGGKTAYAFEREQDYYADLQASRFGITAKRAGWDALRHYEIAANGAVPCFRDLDAKPPRCAPHGLGPGNSIVYSSWSDLRAKLDGLGAADYARLQESALRWARENTTRVRASQLLAEMGL